MQGWQYDKGLNLSITSLYIFLPIHQAIYCSHFKFIINLSRKFKVKFLEPL